ISLNPSRIPEKKSPIGSSPESSSGSGVGVGVGVALGVGRGPGNTGGLGGVAGPVVRFGGQGLGSAYADGAVRTMAMPATDRLSASRIIAKSRGDPLRSG